MPNAAQTPGEAAAGVAPVRPFLKWAGGKGQLLAAFEAFYPRPEEMGGYLEPFLGSGAVFFHVQAVRGPARVVLRDGNPHLVEAFHVVKGDVERLIELLDRHKKRHDRGGEDYFYKVRDQPGALKGPTERAARLIYLNKTCFNGLYRVNSKGRFNVPFGRYKNPTLYDPVALREASLRLRGADLAVGDFRAIAGLARPGDFVYLDPPYHPLSGTAYFTSYTEGSFGEKDQRELAEVFRALDQLGCKVMLSNSDTPLINQLYRGFSIERVYARRNINSRAERRGKIAELVVTNYAPPGKAASRSAAKSAKVANRAADSPT